MAKYIAWHTGNCRCIPADADAAQDNTHTNDAAKARRDNLENEK